MLRPKALDQAQRRIEEGQRIDYQLAESLLTEAGLDQLQLLADLARRKRVGEKVYFISNHHLYYTNVCLWQCKFCAFSRKPAAADAYTKTLDDIAAELGGLSPDVSEIRVTGGVNPRLDFDYYRNLIALIRSKVPQAHIEAFAPTEIAFIAQKSRLSAGEVLTRLKDAGLNSLTSGGAEIFNSQLRQKLCPHKTSTRDWINISQTAHSMGIPSNASMLFGHLETYSDWLEHLFILRKLQDRTGGFNSFIPLRFLPQNTGLDSCSAIGFSEVLRMVAISRIVLDNFKPVKFLWIYYGSQRIREALSFGANDLAGTAYETHKGVARSAASGAPAYISRQELVKVIKECRRVPVERGSLYQEKYVYN